MEIEMSRQCGSSVTVEHIAGDSHVIVSRGVTMNTTSQRTGLALTSASDFNRRNLVGAGVEETYVFSQLARGGVRCHPMSSRVWHMPTCGASHR